jgi:hypothetical protein
VATATFTKPVQSLVITLIYSAGALAILGYVFRRMGTQSVGIRDALQTIRYRTVTALRSGTFREVTRVGLVFVPFALGLSLFVAPHMSVDSQVVAAFELNDFVMPHCTNNTSREWIDLCHRRFGHHCLPHAIWRCGLAVALLATIVAVLELQARVRGSQAMVGRMLQSKKLPFP